MKINHMLSDLEESLPRVTKGGVKRLLILATIFTVCLAIFVVAFYFFAPAEQFVEGFQRYGYPGVFLANLLCSLSVVVPAPPGLAVTVAVATINNWMWVALAASLGGTLGEITAYYVGYGGQKFVALESSQRYNMVEGWMNRYGGIAISIFAFVPIFIFDFVGIAAGALKYPVGKFFLFCYAGRLPRACIEAYFGAELFKLIIPYLPQWASTPFAPFIN